MLFQMGLLISERTYTVISRTYTQTVSAAPMAINNKKVHKICLVYHEVNHHFKDGRVANIATKVVIGFTLSNIV